MASGFFGAQLDPAEEDLRAADYLRKRVALVTEAIRLMTERLDAHAREFESRGTQHVRGLFDEAADPDEADRDAEGLIRAIRRNITKSEPGPDHLESRLRSIAEAAATDDLQTVLKLIGEELVLPIGTGASSQIEGEETTSPSRHPARTQPQRKQTTPNPAAAVVRERASAAPGDDAFFGVAVPAHEHEKALLIIADARQRAAEEGHYRNSQYTSGRGRNEWQPKLLKAAFAQAIEEIGPAEAIDEIGSADAGSDTPATEPEQDLEPAEAAPAASVTASAAEPIEEQVDLEITEPAAVTSDTVVETHTEPELSAEPPDEEFFGDDDDEASTVDAQDEVDTEAQYAEPPFEDPDDAPEITTPLQPLPRPQPTVLDPPPISRTAPPPVRPPGSGLMASRVGARPVAPPQTRDRV